MFHHNKISINLNGSYHTDHDCSLQHTNLEVNNKKINVEIKNILINTSWIMKEIVKNLK